jgi:N-acetylglucosamine kinase-like BadF-type ATPase
MLGVGIDSGGTRTTFAVDNGSGPHVNVDNECGASISDSRNSESVRLAFEWITEIIQEQDDDEICVWIGAAGFDASTAKAIGEMSARPVGALADWAQRANKSLEVFIANDAVSLLKAPPLNGAGIVAIIGTGSVVMGAHPDCTDGIIKRGGYEWVATDEGAGVWMTIKAVQLLLDVIQSRGPQNYRSALLDRLVDYMGITEDETSDVPSTHRALAKAGLVARRMAASRPDLKRYLASFVYPHIFDLASMEPGRPHDAIAAETINRSVQAITRDVKAVSETVAAFTADDPNLRERMPLVVGGNIAANPIYDSRLRGLVSGQCRFISSVSPVGDMADELATLAYQYLDSSPREQRTIARGFDPLHPIVKLI